MDATKEPRRRRRAEDDQENQQSNNDAPPPTTKSGWGSESTSAAPSSDFQQQKPLKPRNHWDDSVQDLPVIPDLEEDTTEDITRQVAAPPTVRVQKVQAIRDLSHDMKFSLPTNPEAGVDLSILTSGLCPQSLVTEEDEPWEYDQLVQEIATALINEQEEEERDAASK
eukprot:GILK01002932.1.p1 GENE.GILK01002932.1~~GILK01002932.1.p1  ORF type:complete len:187 (-),score=27.76 GILK01002932.1:105-608(-)